ncbi:hypothetical protein HYV87_03125 [Candidatus Woesearchaeota archaeon]|nr:hypothetical protein [Candidatus Woesearchaeota archaeon]
MSLDYGLSQSRGEEVNFTYDVPVEMTMEAEARLRKFLCLGVVLGDIDQHLGKIIRNETVSFPESVPDYIYSGSLGVVAGFLLCAIYERWRKSPHHD